MLGEDIRMALASMAGNRLRTFLSLLGIMIGVASVVAILNLGRSVTESISESFEIGGLDTVNVMPRGQARETMIFTEEFAYDLMEEIEGANGTPIAEKKERSLRVLSLKNGDDAPRYCILSFVRRQG